MQCPKCLTAMTATARVHPSDARFLLTTHLCTACTKRVLVQSPNVRYVPPPTRDATPPSPRRRTWRMPIAMDEEARPALTAGSVPPHIP